jgi:hypothetical protein
MPFIEVIHEYVLGVSEGGGGGFSELCYVEGFWVVCELSIQRLEGRSECALSPTGMGPWIGPDQVVSIVNMAEEGDTLRG